MRVSMHLCAMQLYACIHLYRPIYRPFEEAFSIRSNGPMCCTLQVCKASPPISQFSYLLYIFHFKPSTAQWCDRQPAKKNTITLQNPLCLAELHVENLK